MDAAADWGRFGAGIKERRRRRGLSREQLADLVEVSPGQLVKWEQGRVVPRTRFVLALTRELGRSVLDLYGEVSGCGPTY